MLRHILNLKEIESRKMMWLVVLHTNNRAIQFYGRYGFEKLKTYYHTIGSRLLEYDLMIKKLQTPFEIFSL